MLSLRVEEPSVELLSQFDNRFEAWVFSRPQFDEEKLKSEYSGLGATDLPLNAIAGHVFNINSSVVFRELVLSLRPIHPWARSQRSTPMTKANVKYCAHIETLENVEYDAADAAVDHVMDLIENQGVIQDIARDELPLGMSVNYTISIDSRTLIGFLKTIYELSDELHCYVDLFLDAIGKDLEWLFEQGAKPFLGAYKMTDREIRDCSDGGYTSSTGELQYVAIQTTVSHAAQFLRMHHARVKTEMWTIVAEQGYTAAKLMKGKSQIKTVAYTDAAVWRRTMQTRSHWFVQFETWGPILMSYLCSKGIGPDEFWHEFLPNGAICNGDDPYLLDSLIRVEGGEVNLPCPITCGMRELIWVRDIEESHTGTYSVIDLYKDMPIPDEQCVRTKYGDQWLEMMISRASDPSHVYHSRYLDMLNKFMLGRTAMEVELDTPPQSLGDYESRILKIINDPSL